jgi:hypothetical protein
MEFERNSRLSGPPIAFSLSPGFPPGVRLGECDGAVSLLDDASGSALWRMCEARQQEALSERFVDAHAETLRDAILDLEDARSSARSSPAAALANLIWSSWIIFRDRALRDLLTTGQLAGP